MVKVQDIVLNQLLHNPEYKEKVISYLKPEYFQSKIEKNIFMEYLVYVSKYVRSPSVKELYILLERKDIFNESEFKHLQQYIIEHLNKKESVEYNWLIDETEKWIQDTEIYLAINQSLELIEGQSSGRNEIPEILKKALSVSLNQTIGIEYLNDQDVLDIYNYYNTTEEKVPFDLTAFNNISGGGVPRKTLNNVLGATNSGKCGRGDMKINIKNKKTGEVMEIRIEDFYNMIKHGM